MGIATRICSENKKEMRMLKKQSIRILRFNETYPKMGMERRMQFTIRLNEIAERVKYLKVNKLNSQSPEWDYTLVLKKNRVKNRKL